MYAVLLVALVHNGECECVWECEMNAHSLCVWHLCMVVWNVNGCIVYLKGIYKLPVAILGQYCYHRRVGEWWESS